MKKIVILLKRQAHLNDIERYGIENLKLNNYFVEIWDCSFLFLKENYTKTNIKLFSDLPKNIFKIIKSKKDFYLLLHNSISGNIFIDNNDIIEIPWVRRFLNEKHLTYGKIFLGQIPSVNFSIKEKIHFIFYKIYLNPINFFIHYTNFFKNIFFNYFLYNNYKFNYSFYLSSGSNINSCNNVNKKKIVKAHSFDYEKFLKYKNLNLNDDHNDRYSVFIDEGASDHPDFETQSIKPYANKNFYHKELNNFFDLYESLNNHKIIIAGHPRLNYNNKGIFGGRTLVEGNTLELISQCENVLTHMSTAINFAVLFKKPIINLDSDNYSFVLKGNIYSFSKELDSLVVNISKNTKFKPNKIKINLEKYLAYEHRFIHYNDNTEISLWDKFYERYLKKIH